MGKFRFHRAAYIYTLQDPRNGSVRYIGCTYRLNGRFMQHLREAIAGRDKSKKADWIRELHALLLKPIYTIIETTSMSNACAREYWWIRYYRAEGQPLFNIEPIDVDDVERYEPRKVGRPAKDGEKEAETCR